MKLFVGNIPFSMSEEDLRETFEEFGSMISCKLIKDAETGRSRGFGFIEYSSKEEAEAAIENLNETEVQGKRLVVNEARPQEKRGSQRPPRRQY
jgi:RNA recognition motif-containing protein